MRPTLRAGLSAARPGGLVASQVVALFAVVESAPRQATQTAPAGETAALITSP